VPSPRSRAVYVAVLVAALGAVQGVALVLQFKGGFVPFVHAPTRVPYSWDMFSIKIDRCVVAWDPPLSIEGRRVASWHDRMPDLEFDGVFNNGFYYAAAAQAACAYRTDAPTAATVTCFTGDGSVHAGRIDCP